jgi:hypothetical protein
MATGRDRSMTAQKTDFMADPLNPQTDPAVEMGGKEHVDETLR